MSANKTLRSQMMQTGYAASDITYLAMSHYHADHTANAPDFAGATWLVRQVERDAVFAEKPPAIVRPEHFAALKNSKTTILKDDDYDVFGDGTVIIKSTPGHTPGHQVLFAKLAKTGPVLIAGDFVSLPGRAHLEHDLETNAKLKKAPAYYD